MTHEQLANLESMKNEIDPSVHEAIVIDDRASLQKVVTLSKKHQGRARSRLWLSALLTLSSIPLLFLLIPSQPVMGAVATVVLVLAARHFLRDAVAHHRFYKTLIRIPLSDRYIEQMKLSLADKPDLLRQFEGLLGQISGKPRITDLLTFPGAMEA